MFPYDATLLETVRKIPQTIDDVLQAMQTIDAICVDGDGLKWFNWLYMQVTYAVKARSGSGGFRDPAWIAQLDVEFARLYFGALEAALSGETCPDCWEALFSSRDRIAVARIQ